MRRRRTETMLFAVLFVAGAWSRPAAAQDGDEPTVSMVRDAGVHRRPADFSVLAGAPGFGLAGVGGGVRLAIPLVHDGFLSSVNDAVFIEAGAEFIHWTYGPTDPFNSITVPLHMRWNFYLAKDWTAFGAAGFEFSYFLGSGFFEVPNTNVPFFNAVQGGVITFGVGGGVLYNFSEATSLRIDAALSLLAIGVTLRF